MKEQLGRWVGDAHDVLHLDLHTGLDRWATCKLLLDRIISEPHRNWLHDKFGAYQIRHFGAAELAYQVQGSLGAWCHQELPGRNYLYLCAEFGTYSQLKVLSGLRAEHQAHHWGQAEDSGTVRAKQRLKELFCPASHEWRKSVLQPQYRAGFHCP